MSRTYLAHHELEKRIYYHYNYCELILPRQNAMTSLSRVGNSRGHACVWHSKGLFPDLRWVKLCFLCMVAGYTQLCSQSENFQSLGPTTMKSLTDCTIEYGSRLHSNVQHRACRRRGGKTWQMADQACVHFSEPSLQSPGMMRPPSSAWDASSC